MYSKKIKQTAWLTVLVLLIAACLPLRAKAQEHVISVHSSASSAVLYEVSSGRVLFEKHAHVKRPMASTTKLMTALLAAECLPKGAMLTASREALSVEGSSMGLCVGDVVSREALLYGLLLSSGNDAANVLALSMAESYEGFAAMMNRRAAQIGMTDTHFVTPSGLDAQGHGASAYDMALLAAKVLENDTLSAICACKSQTVLVGERSVTLTNHNKLLSQYPDCIGMKTGYTSLAGRCLVSAATRNGVTLVAVTLDCPNDWQEHTTMLDEGFALTESVVLDVPDVDRLCVFGGASSSVSLTVDPVCVTLLKGEKAAIETKIIKPSYLWAPVKQGAVVGTVEYHLKGMLLKTVPIKVTAFVAEQNRESVRTRAMRLFWLLLRELLT